jgi:hypothetical protein
VPALTARFSTAARALAERSGLSHGAQRALAA